jgi:hypothetical protein
LPEVAANATLIISCRNYNSTTIRAAPGPASIRLTPIPVRVKVASALTGAPLPAAIQTPDRVRVVAGAAGVATVYRVGPGDRMTVSAAGYRPASVRVGADRTVRAGLQPLAWKTAAVQIVKWYQAKKYAAIANWVLSPATGYEFSQHSPETSPGIVTVEAQVGGQSATMLVSAFPDGIMDVRGSFKGGGSRATIAGQETWHGTVNTTRVPGGPPPSRLMGTIWFRSPMSIIVYSDTLNVTDKIMAAILATLPSK